jgi:integrase/recombinase XerD
MTPLRQRMIEDMQLRGLSERTQEAYVAAVRQLAKHYGKSPDQIGDEELRQYFLYLTNEKKASHSAITIALCAIKFLYEQTLHQEWPTLTFVRPPREHKLPVILSREEVQRILSCLRRPHYRVCLTTIYSCGLRLQEGVRLQVSDIDSDRMVMYVHQGKGSKDRYVPLPQPTLERMRRIFILVLLAALFVYRINHVWPQSMVLWPRRLGGKLDHMSDRDGHYVQGTAQTWVITKGRAIAY